MGGKVTSSTVAFITGKYETVRNDWLPQPWLNDDLDNNAELTKVVLEISELLKIDLNWRITVILS